MRHEEPGQSAVRGGGGGLSNRHLLSLSSSEQDLDSISPHSCAALNMTYTTNNRSQAVNLTNDQVS